MELDGRFFFFFPPKALPRRCLVTCEFATNVPISNWTSPIQDISYSVDVNEPINRIEVSMCRVSLTCRPHASVGVLDGWLRCTVDSLTRKPLSDHVR